MGKNAVQIRRIKSIKDFTDYLTKDNTPDTVLFRGQVEDLPLVPKIGRLEVDRPVIEAERAIFDNFKQQALPFLERTPDSEWEWLAIAQHHGLPTRLLDWTLNPLVALWFTVASPPKSKMNGVVWAFKPQPDDFVNIAHEDPFSPGRTKVFRPSHVAERIRAQAGYFTVHKYLDKSNKFVPFGKIAAYKPRLTKLVVVRSSFADIRFRLDQYGINQSIVFPGLDGLSKHIQWLHTFLNDEKHLRRTIARMSWDLPT
jgi:FRG domain